MPVGIYKPFVQDVAERVAVILGSGGLIDELLGGDGTPGAPTHSFTSTPTAGMYLPATNTLGWSTNSVLRASLSTTQFLTTLPFITAVGSASSPALANPTNNNSGWYWTGNNTMAFSVAGTPKFHQNDGWVLSSDFAFGWTNTTNAVTGTVDLTFFRDAANIVGQRNGTNSQAFRLYRTYTSAANNEYLAFRFETTNAQIFTDFNAPGVARPLQLGAGGQQWQIGTDGHLTALGAYNIGDGAGASPVLIYWEKSASLYGVLTASGATNWGSDGCMVVRAAGSAALGLAFGMGDDSTSWGFGAANGDPSDGSFYPGDDNTRSVGLPASRVKSFYAGTSFDAVGYASGSRLTSGQVKQATSGNLALSGASVTATNLIPAGAFVIGVAVTITTTITGASGFQVGDGSDADRWGDITGTAVGTNSDNADATANPTGWFAAANNVVLTAKTSNFTGGVAQVTVFYLTTTAT